MLNIFLDNTLLILSLSATSTRYKYLKTCRATISFVILEITFAVTLAYYVCVCSVFPAEVQQLLVMKEDPPEWSLSLDQQDRESLQIKEEQEELWTNQEGEQHNGLKVTDVTTFPFTIVTVKSEDDDKEKSQSLQLHQSQTEDNSEMEPLTSSPAKQVKTEPDEEDCGRPESEGSLHTHIYLPKTDVKASDSSETEVSNDDDDWKEPVSDSGPKTKDSDDIWKVSRERESGINSQGACNPFRKSFSCSECCQQFLHKRSLQRHDMSSSRSSLVTKKCRTVKKM